MAPKISLLPALAAALLAPFAAHAARAPAPPADPCANAAVLTTRDQILAAIKPDDSQWSEALRKRGIRKEDDGSWMQYFQGGSATASNAAFTRALGDYCTERTRASQRAISEAAHQARADKQREAIRAERMVSYTENTTKKQAEVATKTLSMIERAKLLFAAEDEQKNEAANIPAPPDAAQCQQWKAMADQCEGNISMASASGFGLGTEAKCYRATQNYKTCPR